MAEVYYVMKGEGTATVSSRGSSPETAGIHGGDAIPLRLSEVHAFENTGAEPLEFMVIGVSRDAGRTVDTIDASRTGQP